MVLTLRHDEHVSLVESHHPFRSVGFAQVNVEPAVEHHEELVGVFMVVPDVLAFGLGDSNVVVVDPRDDPRAPRLVERSERVIEADRLRGRSLSGHVTQSQDAHCDREW